MQLCFVTCDIEGDPLRPTALNERQAETGPASKDEFVRMHRDELTRPDPCSRSTGDDKAGKLAPGPCVPPPVGGRCWRGKNPNYGFADPLRLQAQPGFAAQIAASARNTRKGQDTGLIKINALSESARRLRAEGTRRKLAVHTERVLGDVSQSNAVLEHLAELLGAELAWGEADLVKHPPEPVLRMSVVGAPRG